MFAQLVVTLLVSFAYVSADSTRSVHGGHEFMGQLRHLVDMRGRNVEMSSLVESHARALTQLQDVKHADFGKKHNFFLHMDTCFVECQNSLEYAFGKENYETISADYGSLYASEEEILDYMNDISMKSSTAGTILSYTPTTIDSKVSQWATSGCDEFNEQQIQGGVEKVDNSKGYVGGERELSVTSIIFVHVAALSEDDLSQFKTKMQSVSDLYGDDVELDSMDMKLMRTNTRNYVRFHVKAGVDPECEKTNTLVNVLAEKREIKRIDRQHEVYLSNRWAKPICQTGEGTNQAISVQGKLDGTDQIVGVTDTGLDLSSCYFRDPSKKAKVLSLEAALNDPSSSFDLTQRKVIQYINFKDDSDDGSGHGTHVAGSVAGKSTIDYGDFVKYNGAAPEAKIAFFDLALSSSTSGAINLPSDLTKNLFAVMYTTGARIITNSWGSPTAEYTVHCVMADKFMYDNQDSLLLFAGGNAGDITGKTSSITSPGGAKNVLTVGASLSANDVFKAFPNTVPDGVDDDFNQNNLAYFSSKGPSKGTVQRIKPDICAPGWWISSAAAVSGNTASSPPHCTLNTLQGTSMATPILAGTAALVRQYFMNGMYPTGERVTSNQFTPLGSLIKAILVHSGQPINKIVKVNPSTGHSKANNILTTGGQGGNNYPNNDAGFGRVQIDNVLNFGCTKSNGGSTCEPPNNPLQLFVIGDYNSGNPTAKFSSSSQEGSSQTFFFKAGSTNPIRITHAYTDSPSAIGNGGPVNDLTLSVDACTGSGSEVTSLANGGGSCQTPVKAADPVGTKPLQMVNIKSPTKGRVYRVTITATGLADNLVNPQPFSIVMTQDITEYADEPGNNPFPPFTTKNTASAQSYVSEGAAVVIAAFAVLTLILVIIVTVIYLAHKRADVMEEKEITAAINSLASNFRAQKQERDAQTQMQQFHQQQQQREQSKPN